ncbi:MAG: sulfotransferase [Pseudomonadota bacterium]
MASEKEDYQVSLEDALNLARGHHASGNLILAERTYRDILRAVPDHYPTTQLLGVLLFQTRAYEEATQYFQKAVEAAPEDAQSFNNYGGTLMQLGRTDEALPLYTKAIELQPEYLDAINNKAYALWKMGEFKEAEALSRKALEIDENNLMAMNGLGMALAKQVKFEEAIDMFKKAAELDPERSIYLINWGNTLREMGRFDRSELVCRKAVDLEPDNPEALNNLANSLRDQAKTEEAIETYKDATNLKPDYHEAHANLAIAYMDAQDFFNASIAAKYATAFDHNYALGFTVLSQALRELGEIDQAYAAAQRAMYLNPESADPHLEVASVLVQMDRYEDAEAAVAEALKHEPDHARAFLELATIRDKLHDFERAVEAVEQGLEISPDMVALWQKKANLYLQNNEGEQGLEFADKAIEIMPNSFQVYQQKADMLVSLNRNDEAEKYVRKALSIRDDVPMPYGTLSSLKKFKSKDDPDFKKMKEIEPKVEALGSSQAMSFSYTMSEVHEQMGEYDEAFGYLEKASELRLKQVYHHFGDEMKRVENAKRNHTAEKMDALRQYGVESEMPVFIVGMPRSGTTLTEQIISSHPDVYGAGELTIFSSLVKEAALETGKVGEEEMKRIGEGYLEGIQRLDKTGKAKRVTDKMPGNYTNLPLISAVFPNARIIHCRRNPIDTCLSCYKQNFAVGHYWSYDLEALGDHYLSYQAMMEYYREEFDGRFLEINYEDTVGDLENQARKLIDYVGLEWDDACLEPHKQKRTVLTASKAQVTKKVYKTSVEKWRRYEKHLQPLVRKLLPDQALPEDKPAKGKKKASGKAKK